MKKVIFLFALVFAVSAVIAQSNLSNVDVTGDDNLTKVVQLGMLNVSDVDVVAPGGMVSQDNTIRVFQPGTDNFARTYVQGDDNLVRVEQGGESSTARVRIASIFGYSSNGNTAKIFQNGNSDDNFAKAKIVGDDNLVRIDQDGHDNRAEIHVGLKNEGLMPNSESDGNVVRLTQAPYGSGNYNEFYALIDGDDNRVLAEQRGFSNNVGTSYALDKGLMIMGDDNFVDIFQRKRHNDSYNTITGDGNTVLVEQGGF